MLDHARLRAALHYNPETGVWTRLIKDGRAHAGERADKPSKRGRRIVSLRLTARAKKAQHFAHRLAWFYVREIWPPGNLDHKNGNPDDNRWSNLRLATHAQNAANAKRNKNNTSGFKGVRRANKAGWRASIWVNRKNIHLGCRATPAEAFELYKKAARHYFGEFARYA